MPELRRPSLAPGEGRALPLDVYDSDFDRYDEAVRDHDCWKLERAQTFAEDEDPSYDAFRRGEWSAALRLHEEMAPQLRESAEARRQRGSVFHRVRVVEEPLTPYTQWELHSLRVQAAHGRPVRVIPADAVRHLEPPDQGPLPELVILGGLVLYRVSYSDEGALDGAVRYTSPETVRQWERLVSDLFARGEDVVSYVERYVARLPPPAL
jgi:hypothetical protein